MKSAATQKPNPEGKHAFVLQMPVSLHAQLKERAEKEERSVNAQVRHFIEQGLKEAA